MTPNRSPWIAELRPGRASVGPLIGAQETDIVVVGGGIAGAATTYFLLAQTDVRVMLIEADKVAHGASGHNAGQLTTQFEKAITELEESFGPELTSTTLQDLERAWGLLETMRVDAAPDVTCHRFKGYVAVSTKEQAQRELDDLTAYQRLGVHVSPLVVADDWKEGIELGEAYPDLVRLAPLKEITERLETIEQAGYRAYATFNRGVANSALLVTRVLETLLARHPGRFVLHEGSPAQEIMLEQNGVDIKTPQGSVYAARVVLCTNGFEGFKIRNNAGVEIDPRFHHDVYGTVGYMAGYYLKPGHAPAAISYIDRTWKEGKDPYYYVTRRPYANGVGRKDLLCIGGPEHPLPEPERYTRLKDCPDDIRERVDGFIKQTFGKKNPDQEFAFCWHGLMGYTQNGVRLVGAEPCNPTLLYNLGCNGIGLLPSIYGAERIARLINGEKLPPTFFDPQDKRCATPPKKG